jgi:hypothetical protein
LNTKVTVLKEPATGDATPTEQLLAKAAMTVSKKDSTGRVIVLKKPGVLAQYRIVEVCGDSASNAAYMNMILPLIFVAELGGQPRTQPANKLQLEALIQELDEHGIDAVMAAVEEHWGKQSDPEAEKAAIKK